MIDFSYSCAAADKMSTDLRARAVSLRQLSYLCCMIASDTLFDSKGGFSGSSYPMKTADFEVLRDVAMAIIFGFLYMGCILAPTGY